MGSGGLEHKPGSVPDVAARQADEPTYVPRGESGRSWPRADPMRSVRLERQEAAAQIQRSLKAWRKEPETKRGADAARIPHHGGAPLASDLRRKMEEQLGTDLGDAKIHTSGESAKAAEGMGARAFTVGNEVHFGTGEYAPGTKEGDKLLAHELTHVAQRQQSGVQRKVEKGDAGERVGHEVSHPDEPAEKEADAVAERATHGLHDGPSLQAGGEPSASAKTDPVARPSEAAVKAAPIAAKLKPGGVALKKKDDVAKPNPSAQTIVPTRPTSSSAGSPTAKSGGNAEGGRVRHPIPGLYDSINGCLAEKKPLQVGELVFKDKVDQKYANGAPRQVTTFVEVPGNDKAFGQVTRSLEVAKDGSRTLVMDMAFLDTIPKELSWVTEDGKALKPGRGIPLQTYLTIRQMKILGIDYGDLGKPSIQKVKLSTVVNQRTIWELAEFTKKEPGAPDSEHLKRTHSVSYADTVITQAGAKILEAQLENATVTTAREYATQKNTPEEPKKRGLAPTDPVRKNFDIHLKVVPFSSKSTVPSEINGGDA
jgi:hypothetical protein